MTTKIYPAIIVAAALALSGCTNSNDARKALEAQGFTEIETGGYAPFACSRDDFYHTKFTATNSQGNRVSGTVCSGFFFKNSTIRW